MRSRGTAVLASLALITGVSVIGPAGLMAGSGAAALAELSFYAMAADDMHDRVFLSGGAGSSFLQVHGFDWAQVAVVADQPGASDLELSASSDRLFGYYRSAAHADLVVAGRGENGGAGAVTLIYGSPTGLTATGSTMITQDTSGVPDTPQTTGSATWTDLYRQASPLRPGLRTDDQAGSVGCWRG